MMIASYCRRALLGVSLGVLATLSAFSANADQITFVSQGGAYQKAQTIAILDPSAKKLGITINQDSIPDAWPAIKSQVASGKPTKSESIGLGDDEFAPWSIGPVL